MADPTPDQVQMAQEVLAGNRQITGSSPAQVEADPAPPPVPESLAGMSDEAKQQLYDVRTAMQEELSNVRASGHVDGLEAKPELEVKQAAFERSEIAQDIQRVNDIKAPGE